ncbi:MAG: hypothetical protein LBB48_00005 [Treponema sp.]|nr:hypothetical protein [Treponema sp.]
MPSTSTTIRSASARVRKRNVTGIAGEAAPAFETDAGFLNGEGGLAVRERGVQALDIGEVIGTEFYHDPV